MRFLILSCWYGPPAFPGTKLRTNRLSERSGDSIDCMRRIFARNPRQIADKELTQADFQKYNVVLFGDPGSNVWIARMASKLPIRWYEGCDHHR